MDAGDCLKGKEWMNEVGSQPWAERLWWKAEDGKLVSICLVNFLCIAGPVHHAYYQYDIIFHSL